MKRRDEVEIIFDMLNALKEKGEMAKTALMHAANLDWKNFKKKWAFLREKGLIAANNENPGKIDITDKGKKFISDFKKIQKALA